MGDTTSTLPLSSMYGNLEIENIIYGQNDYSLVDFQYVVSEDITKNPRP